MPQPDLFQAVPIPLVHIRPDRIIAAANPPAEALFGTWLAGRHYATMLRKPPLVKKIEAVLAGGKAANARLALSHDGRERVFRVAVSPLDPGGGALISFEDVTLIRHAARTRSDFVANISHELRTPLTAITGFIETLRGPARDDAKARAQFLEMMTREAERMNRMIGDLLSLARVEDVERDRPTALIDLCQAIRDAVATIGVAAGEAGVGIEISGCDQAVRVPGDGDQLRQVFTNLVENAVKYGASGGRVRVTLTRQAHQPLLRGPCARIEVRDWGTGISERHIGRLTERFYRADKHRARGAGGTGLGLAIVKHILNRHAGRLRIESEEGQGSTFTVLLPLS